MDEEGKRMIRDRIEMAQRPEFRRRLVFLEDDDIALAQEMVQGVDVWINTPRRPWEACGTSGMKVLVNGGLDLSERGLKAQRSLRTEGCRDLMPTGPIVGAPSLRRES
jgi:glucan phosphorylase